MSEFILFREDDDKDYYLVLLKKYTDRFKCSIYAYCLMDNHLHLHFDPKGFDVSKFMQSLNTAYVRYYNKKYRRHGPVFQARFESRILSTDEYNFAVSAYIHNNPQGIPGFCGKEETYRYSSYGIYLGLRQDLHHLVDLTFMKGLFALPDEKDFPLRHCQFVSHQRDIGSLTELKKKLSSAIVNEYVSGRKILLREFSPAKVMSLIAARLMVYEKGSLAIKAKQKLLKYRAFTAYALRVLCGLSYKEICASLYNITLSGCSRLCSRGYELLEKDPICTGLFDELMSCKT